MGLYYRCDKKAAIYLLNNSVLNVKGVLKMDFGPNVSPVEIIKKGAFGVKDKSDKNSWKEFK